jgi:hypothetical protein
MNPAFQQSKWTFSETYPLQRLHAKFSAWLQNPHISITASSSEPHDLQIVSVIQEVVSP